MNKANECTCPSGDGSLVHPCPAHPAVEQAGANVGHGHVFPRADGVKMRCGGPGLCSECTADASRARAALAQPSPAPELAERGTQHRFSTTEQTCRHDFAGVWWNDNGETKTGRECRHCGFFVADVTKAQAEQAEAERPEVVATMYTHHDDVDFREFVVVGNCDKGCEGFYGPEKLMTVAQHERIVGELRAVIAQLRQHKNDYMDSGQETYRALQNEIREREAEIARLDGLVSGRTAERDAALARVAELERQEPVALANRGLHAFWVKWTEAAAGLYGPGIKLYTAPVAQAQHSVPEVSGIGRDFAYPRSVVLYLRTEPTDDDLRAIHDGLRSLAAAPGKEVPQAWLDVQAERRRQVEAEGWTPEHDDEHADGQMAQAAGCYALHAGGIGTDWPDGRQNGSALFWPWDKDSWKPTTPRRDLVKACALALAEIERLDRAGISQSPQPGATTASS